MYKIITLLAMTFIFMSCTSGKTVKKAQDINYLKARINTTWLYSGELLKNKKDISIKIKEVKNKVFIDNKSQEYTVDKNGYKNQYYYLIKFPIKKGSTWVNNNDKITEVATIESLNESFKFGEDTITQCIKVSYVRGVNNGARNITVRVFCPELWMVSMETFYENSEGIATKQSSFTLSSFVY
jgi:hypothetical protein